jgi:hypothetical protein
VACLEFLVFGVSLEIEGRFVKIRRSIKVKELFTDTIK